jgi:hypothetical protein
MYEFLMGGLGAALAAGGMAAWGARRRNLHRWLGSYLRTPSRRQAPTPGHEVHLLLCIADHFEPKHGQAAPAHARARIDRWVHDYPFLFSRFRDSDGQPPRHTFFYPMEQYDSAEVAALAELCHAGFGEIEVHLHHEKDTAANLRERLLRFKDVLALRHGLLGRRYDTGEPAYGFVHGDWALGNSHPHGKCCGVNEELAVLRATGCYADFTMPSAPDPTQPRKINSLYYSRSDPARPGTLDTGVDAGTQEPPEDALLLIQGPLLLNWKARKWGLLPRIENGCLQENQPPSAARLEQWLRARIQVNSRPDWFFVKLHSHGAAEENQAVLLGDPMVRFHEALALRAAADTNFYFHYVSAREMYNLVRAAEMGWTGSVHSARDFELALPGRGAQAAASVEAAQTCAV